MDISADQSTANGNPPGLFSTAMTFVAGVFSRLIGVFTLTETDRRKAGIHLGSRRM
jgi:hypothetical protein